MGSVQSSSTGSVNLAAQQNSGLQSTIQNTQASITALQPQVSNYTAQVQAASAQVAQDYQALAADPTNKDLLEKLTVDLNALQAANTNLSSASDQLQSLINQLPTIIAAAKAQDEATNAQQKTSANSAQQAKDAQATASAQTAADAAQQTLTSANTALGTGQSQFSTGSAKLAAGAATLGDSYGGGRASSASSSAGGLSDMVGANSSASTAGDVSASGSVVNATTILSHENIDGRSWLKQHADAVKAQIGANAFDNLISSLDKAAEGGDDSSSKTKGKPSANSAGGATMGAASTGGALGSVKLGASNSAIPSTAVSNTSADGGISGSQKLGASFDPAAPTAGDPQAVVNPSNLSANEILMLVMLEATDELNKEMQGMAQQLQKATAQKTTLRGQLNQINGSISFATNLDAPTAQSNAKLKAQSTNIQNALDSIGDDTQMMQLRLQNLMQMQQQFIQAVSNISKNLNDTSMAVLRHIGS